MQRLLRICFYLGLALLFLTAIATIGVYRASQQAPKFYVEALSVEPEKQAEAGDELEREALELNNQVRQEGRWVAHFTDKQINGWLASDLPEKFPRMLPAGVSAPRVALERSLAQIACRYEQSGFSTVVVLGVECHLTDEPNTVAVRIRHIRAGQIPVPLGNSLDEISQRAGESGLPLRWSTIEGDPVALITIPEQIEELKDRLLRLETIELRPGVLLLSGRTDPVPKMPTELDPVPPADGNAD